jgi:hypothetical protein
MLPIDHQRSMIQTTPKMIATTFETSSSKTENSGIRNSIDVITALKEQTADGTIEKIGIMDERVAPLAQLSSRIGDQDVMENPSGGITETKAAISKSPLLIEVFGIRRVDIRDAMFGEDMNRLGSAMKALQMRPRSKKRNRR